MIGFIAFIHAPEAASSWGVTFPDVAGCVSAGDTFEAAVEAAGQALTGHLATLATEGDPMPQPRSWAEISADSATMAERDGAFVQMIVPHRTSGERVHIDIAVDRGLLRRADTAAEARGMTRSAYFEAALSNVTGP